MAITEQQLRTLAAEELGIISGTMPLAADEDDKIARRAVSTRAWLLEQGLVYWPSGTIPDAASLPYAMIVAGRCAELFGRGPASEDPYTEGPTGLQALKEHVAVKSAREPVTANYF